MTRVLLNTQVLQRPTVFAYGKLLDAGFRQIALRERSTPFRPAVLRGYRTVDLDGGFRHLEEYQGASVEGRLLYVTRAGLKYLDELSSDAFQRRSVAVSAGEDTVTTQAYFLKGGVLVPAKTFAKPRRIHAVAV